MYASLVATSLSPSPPLLFHSDTSKGLSPEDKGVAMEAFKLYEDEPGKILASNLGEVRMCSLKSTCFHLLLQNM